MPSPTWSTVPTSARSVSTSKSLIRSLRIAVISSGRSFTWFLSCSGDEFSGQSFQPAAHARVDAQRAGLEDDAADQGGVDLALSLDSLAGCLLDLGDDVARLLVGELERRRQLDRQLALLARGKALELLRDLVDLSPAPLLDQQAEDVEDERVGVAGDDVDGRGLGALVELRVAEDLLEVRNLPHRLDEVAELLAHVAQAPGFPRRLEQRPRVGAMDDAQSFRSSMEKSRSLIASSISFRCSSRSSTFPVTFAVAISVSSATSARICSSARCVSASICRFVSSSRRCRSASVSSRTRSRCASATRLASARIDSASP